MRDFDWDWLDLNGSLAKLSAARITPAFAQTNDSKGD
jgi:hypothetical protein